MNHILRKGSTLSLAYYETGNAIWRECFLLKRIAKTDSNTFEASSEAILRTMDVARLEDEELGVEILDMAGGRRPAGLAGAPQNAELKII